MLAKHAVRKGRIRGEVWYVVSAAAGVAGSNAFNCQTGNSALVEWA